MPLAILKFGKGNRVEFSALVDFRTLLQVWMVVDVS